MRAAGYAACEAATSGKPAQGNVGAGAGATVGKLFGIERAMKGGIGSASIRVGARHGGGAGGGECHRRRGRPGRRPVLAGARTARRPPPRWTAPRAIAARRVAGRAPAGRHGHDDRRHRHRRPTEQGAGEQAGRRMAHDGLARCINPVHTLTDGDTLFALATGGSGLAGNMMVLGALAAEVTARAVLSAVHACHRPARRCRRRATSAGLTCEAPIGRRASRQGLSDPCVWPDPVQPGLRHAPRLRGAASPTARCGRRPRCSTIPTADVPARRPRVQRRRPAPGPTTSRRWCCCTSRPATSARPSRAITRACSACCRRRCASAACSRSAGSTKTPPACCCSPMTAR